MRIIYKYPLQAGQTVVQVPPNFKILKLGLQNGIPHVWIEQDNYHSSVKVILFVIYMTGEPFVSDDAYYYLDSFMSGDFVGHVYWSVDP
jgi:hypothetical protein